MRFLASMILRMARSVMVFLPGKLLMAFIILSSAFHFVTQVPGDGIVNVVLLGDAVESILTRVPSGQSLPQLGKILVTRHVIFDWHVTAFTNTAGSEQLRSKTLLVRPNSLQA